MLVIIDAQNCNLHPKGEKYIPESDQLVPLLVKKVAAANQAGEYVLYTQDIPVEEKDKSEDRWGLAIVDELIPLLKPENKVKKYYYGIPPEKLIAIKEQLFQNDAGEKRIEVVGAETNICVLANVIGLQSTFPEADFYISRRLVTAKDKEKEQKALALMEELGVVLLDE
jgi:nicotinamidase-related amidase